MRSWRESVLQVSSSRPLIVHVMKIVTVYNRTQEATSQLHDAADDEEAILPLNLVDQFVSLLLAVYLEAGLLAVRLTSCIGVGKMLKRF